MKTFAKTVTLTAAQVNDLENTPINVVPAPQSGYALIPQNLIVAKTSGTAVGSCANDPICLVYTGDTTPLVSLDAIGAATVSNAVLATGATAATYTAANGFPYASAEVYAGKGIDIGASGATIGSFDGTLQVTVLFNIVKIG
jgi:hypothetical protein